MASPRLPASKRGLNPGPLLNYGAVGYQDTTEINAWEANS
jgi:hypothetical protein